MKQLNSLITKEVLLAEEQLKVKTFEFSTEYQALFNHDNFHRVEIQMTENEWWSMVNEYNNDLGSGKLFNANFVYSGAVGNTTINNIGFRMKGNISRKPIMTNNNSQYRRVHWRIKFDHSNDDQEFAGLSKMDLRYNSYERHSGVKNDYSHTKELYVYDLFNRAGVPTSRTAPARLYLKIGENVIYYGVYTILEPIDKKFLKKRFGGDNDGDLYKCNHKNGIVPNLRPTRDNAFGTSDNNAYTLKTNEDTSDHSAIKDFISNLDSLSGKKLVSYLRDHLKVDTFLRTLAMQKLVGATDDFMMNANNYYIYFSEDGDHEAVLIPVDYDNCMGTGWLPYDTARDDIYDFYSSRPSPVIIEKLLDIPEYRLKYEQYLQEFITPINNLFVNSDYQDRYDHIYDMYHTSSRNYVDNDTVSGSSMHNNGFNDFVHARTRSILRQLHIDFAGFDVN